MDDFGQVDDDMDNGHDMAAIVIDDYEEYDEEYFGEDDGTFASVEEEKKHVSQVPCARTTRLSVDTAYESLKENVHHSEETCNGGYDKMKPTHDVSDIVEEVEEIEEEEVEEEEEEEEEGRERFNRTEVGEPRVSALNRLGPRLGIAAPTSAPVSSAAPTTTTPSVTPAALARPAGGPAAKPIPAKYVQSQCKNIFRRIIIINNLPPSCTDARIKEVVQSKLRGHVTLDFFDGIYGGCCAVLLSSFTAVPAVVAQLNSVLIADSPLSARLMTMQDHATFWSRKLSCLSVAASGSDVNNKWLVVLRNISANCPEMWLFKTLRSEVPSLINLQYLKESSKNSVSILAFALLPTKQDADNFVSKNDERIVNGKQLVACPYYRGFQPQQNQGAKAPALNSSSNATSANTVPTSAAEQQREMQQRAGPATTAVAAANIGTPDRDRSPAAGGRPAAAAELVVAGPAIKLNNHRELLQKSMGANHRVSVHNVAYTVTEDDVIKAVNSKVGCLQFILPFRNNQGCFNGNMLLEFVSPVAARKFHKTMQKFKIKARPIFLKMDTDASRDPQGNIISGPGKPSQFDGPPEMRPRDDDHPVQPPMSGHGEPIPNFGQVVPIGPPLHPMEMGPSRPPHPMGFAPVEPLLGSRLEPMLPTASLHGLPDPVHETYGLSCQYLDNLNITLPLVSKVLLSNVDPHTTDNAVGDLLSLAGSVVTVQVNRALEQAIVEMSHPVEAVEAVSRLHNRIFLERSIAVRLCRQRDFEIFNGLPVSGDPRAFDMPLAASLESRIPPAIPEMMAINPAFNASASAGLDQRLNPSLAPLHDFRPPMGESIDPLASDDLRARLTRPGNRASNVPAIPRGGPAGRGGYGRGAPNDVPPITGGPGLNRPRGGWGGPSDPGGVISVPFLSSKKGLSLSSVTDSFMVTPDRGGKNPSGAGRGGSAPNQGGQNTIGNVKGGLSNPDTANGEPSHVSGGQNYVGAGRGGKMNVPAGRGGQNNTGTIHSGQNNIGTAGGGPNNIGAERDISVSSGTGLSSDAGVPAGREATRSNVGRGAVAAASKVTTIVAVGRGAAASPARGALSNVSVGRGAAISPTMGAASNVIVGRGTAGGPARGVISNVAAGRGAATSPARGAATNVAIKSEAASPARGATSNVAVGRGAAIGSARGATSNVAVGRGAAVSPARGAASNVAVGRGAAVSPARGAASNVAVGRGAAGSHARGATSNVPVARGAAVSIARGAVTNVAMGRGAANTPARGAVTNVAIGRGAATIPARGAATNVAVGRGSAASPARGASTNVAVGRGGAVSSPARGAATNAAVGRGATAPPAMGAATNVAVGRGAATGPAKGASTNVAVGRGAVAGPAKGVTTNVAVGRGAAACSARGAASNISVGRGAAASPARGVVPNVAVGRGAAASSTMGATSNVAVGRGAAASLARGAISIVAVGRGAAATPTKEAASNVAVGRSVAASPARGAATNAAVGRGAVAPSAKGTASNVAVGRGASTSPAVARGEPAATISSGNVSSPADYQITNKASSNVSVIVDEVSNTDAVNANMTNAAAKISGVPMTDRFSGAPSPAKSVVTGSSNVPENTLNRNSSKPRDTPINVKEDQATNSGGTWRTGSLNVAQATDDNGAVKTDSTTGGSHGPAPTLHGIKSTASNQTTENKSAPLNIWDEAERQRNIENQRNVPIVDQGNFKKADHGYNNEMGVGGKNTPWTSGHSGWKGNDRMRSGDSFPKRDEDRSIGWKRDRAGNAWSDEVTKTADGVSDCSAKAGEKEPDHKRFKSDQPAAQDSCVQPIAEILVIPKSVEDNPYLRSYNQSRFDPESNRSMSQDKVAAPPAVWAAGSVPGTRVSDAWNAQTAIINPDLRQPPPIIDRTTGVPPNNVSGGGNQSLFGRDNRPGTDYASDRWSNAPAQGPPARKDAQSDNFKSCYDENPYLTSQSPPSSSSQTPNDGNQYRPKGSGVTDDLGLVKDVSRQYEDAPRVIGERSGAGWSGDAAKNVESTRQVANRDVQTGVWSDQYGGADFAPNRPSATNEFSSGQAGFRQTYERRDGTNALEGLGKGPAGFGANNAEVVRPVTDAKGYTGDERDSDKYSSENSRYGSNNRGYGANSRYGSNTVAYSADASRYGADVGGHRAAVTGYAGSKIDRSGSNAMGHGPNSGAYGASSGAYGASAGPYAGSAGAYAANSGGYGANAGNYRGTSDRYGAPAGSQAPYGSAVGGARDPYNQYGAADRGFGLTEATALGRTALFSPMQSAKLILNNLPMRVQRKDIVDMCSSFGMVRNIDLDPKEMKCRVLFDNPREAAFAARELNDRVFRGSTLRALVA